MTTCLCRKELFLIVGNHVLLRKHLADKSVSQKVNSNWYILTRVIVRHLQCTIWIVYHTFNSSQSALKNTDYRSIHLWHTWHMLVSQYTFALPSWLVNYHCKGEPIHLHTMFCSAMKHSIKRSGWAFLKISEKVEFLVSPSKATTRGLASPIFFRATP